MDFYTFLATGVIERLEQMKIQLSVTEVREACEGGRMTAEEICVPELDELIEAFRRATQSEEFEDYRYACALLGDSYIDITQRERELNENK